MTFMEHTPGRVLVIEDEPQLLEATVTYLNMEGFVADGVAGLNAATQWMRTHLFDILILDLGLGDGDGLDWLQRSSASLDDLIHAGSLFLGVDSPLGPIYIGVGLGEDNQRAVYLQIGQPLD